MTTILHVGLMERSRFSSSKAALEDEKTFNYRAPESSGQVVISATRLRQTILALFFQGKLELRPVCQAWFPLLRGMTMNSLE